MKKFLIGHCPVDSGQILLIDPCYLDKWKDNDFDPNDFSSDLSYNSACHETTKNKHLGGTIGGHDGQGQGVAISSGCGDGYYPVYATYEEACGKRIKSITIKFF